MMQSLQSKLSTGLLFSLFFAFLLLWLLVNINVQFLAEEYIASRLQHDAETLLSAINFDHDGQLILDPSRIDLVYYQPFSGHYYVIDTEQQSHSSRSLWDQTLEQQTVNSGEQLRTIQSGPEQQSLLVLSNGYTKQKHQLTIIIAEDLNPIKANIEQFRYWFSALAFSMLLLLVMLQVFILRSALKPITKIRNEIQSLELGQLDKLSTDVPSELQPLINEVNHLLTLMEQRLHRSRDASSDLAHAIKKPLTVIQHITDKSNIPVSTRKELKKQTDTIYQLTDRILKRARLAGHPGSKVFSFQDDLYALFKTLDMMYYNKTLQLTSHIADNVICPVEREDMLELLGNVLDNAYKWATQKIVVSVTMNTDLHLCIEDDGPGADMDKVNELSKRGVRLDETIEGHGFGLAITAAIIADYQGSISFTRSTKMGGFRTDIRIPLHLSLSDE